MGANEPAGEAVRGGPRSWRAAWLTLIVVILIGTSVASLRAPTARSTLDVAQLQVEALMRARALYNLRSRSELRAPANSHAQVLAVIHDLARIVDASPTPRSIRRLALTQYTFGDSGWRATLLRLRAVPKRGATFDTDRELSLWRQVLDGHVDPENVPVLERQVAEMKLGWYQHLALEPLYRKAGMVARAVSEVEDANHSTSRLLTVAYLAVLTGVAGFVFGIRMVVIALSSSRKRRMDSGLALPQPKPFHLAPLSREASDVLYTGFILYLATFAVVRLIVGQLLGRGIAGLVSGLPSEVGLLVQIGVSLASIAPPLLWLWLKGRHTDLTLERIGLSWRHLPRNVWWGISGYAVALPLVYVASIVSTWLFRGVASPPHPVIADLVATRGPLYLALMFVQVAVIPPVSEELMFRGVFFRALASRMSIPAAAVLTSALFAALHPQLPLGFLGIFVLGVIFNVLYLYRGSLVSPMVAHGLNNGGIFLFFVLLTAE